MTEERIDGDEKDVHNAGLAAVDDDTTVVPASLAPHVEPSRLILAMMRRGMRRWNVSQACGITGRRFWRIERGHVQPTADELKAIADFLRFPVPFFSRPPVDDVLCELVDQAKLWGVSVGFRRLGDRVVTR